MTQSLKSYLPVLVIIAANQAVAEKKIACTMQQTEEIIKEFPEEFVNEVLFAGMSGNLKTEGDKGGNTNPEMTDSANSDTMRNLQEVIDGDEQIDQLQASLDPEDTEGSDE